MQLKKYFFSLADMIANCNMVRTVEANTLKGPKLTRLCSLHTENITVTFVAVLAFEEMVYFFQKCFGAKKEFCF